MQNNFGTFTLTLKQKHRYLKVYKLLQKKKTFFIMKIFFSLVSNNNVIKYSKSGTVPSKKLKYYNQIRRRCRENENLINNEIKSVYNTYG